jgi:hypothetical protein
VSNDLKNNLIEIGGGVNGTADPPAPPGTPVCVTYGKVAGPPAFLTAIGTAGDALAVAVEAMNPRAVGSHHLGNDQKAFTTEFSLPSVIEVINPLKAMLNSDNLVVQKVAQKVFKTSAVVMHLSAIHSAPYEFHAKPRTVALNW